jgi:KDO2-lipid IV(A) lauroyltransferase
VHNPAVDRLLQRRRRALGLQVMPRDRGAAPLVRFLKTGGVVAILLDQHTRARNLEVPFFGHPAPTPAAMATLALKFGIPVLPVAGVWDEARQVLVMRHLPPLRPGAEPGLDEVSFLTQCNAALEELIRRNPEQWVWFHRRWNP